MKQISNELYNQIVEWNSDLWRLENNWKCGKEISNEKLFTTAKKILLNIVSENNKLEE